MMEFSSFTPSVPLTPSVPAGFLCRHDFGSDFLFGSSTSAFQIEGGLRRDGRGKSIFDTFAERLDLFAPYGEDAVNHREHYKEDVKLIKKIGFDSYRFSISWNRILPNGRKDSRSQEGINFYKDLIKNLKDEGIEPMVTLLHFDPPQDLENEYNTFLRPQIVDDFCDFVDVCFQEFGNEVKYWITINAPWYVAYGGYITGEIAPGYQVTTNYEAIQKEKAARSGKTPYDDGSSICPPFQYPVPPSFACQTPPRDVSKLGPPQQWPYLVGHHQILAHAKAVKLYREKYQQVQKGKIGLHFVTQWYIPLEDTQQNREAAKRALDFMLGWFLDPLVKGDYPENMHKYTTKGFLPEFTAEEKAIVKGSFDFVSINYYTSRYVTHEETDGGDYVLDRRVRFHEKKDGVAIGELRGAAGWIYGYPRGLLEILTYIKDNYNNPEIYIVENGIDDADDDSSTHWNSFRDDNRISFIHDHLAYTKQALRRGVNVKGHYVWSLLDNLELAQGFSSRFGIVYVDYDDGSKRRPKLSAAWYKHFLEN